MLKQGKLKTRTDYMRISSPKLEGDIEISVRVRVRRGHLVAYSSVTGVRKALEILRQTTKSLDRTPLTDTIVTSWPSGVSEWIVREKSTVPSVVIRTVFSVRR